MQALFKNRRWRASVGLIAAYALALQMLFAYSIAAQAEAAGLSHSNTGFALCTTGDGVPDPKDAGAPDGSGAHCAVCPLTAPPAAIVPDGIAVAGWLMVSGKRTPVEQRDAILARPPPRVGQSRAPPQNA
jgi:hypothetical protein